MLESTFSKLIQQHQNCTDSLKKYDKTLRDELNQTIKGHLEKNRLLGNEALGMNAMILAEEQDDFFNDKTTPITVQLFTNYKNHGATGVEAEYKASVINPSWGDIHGPATLSKFSFDIRAYIGREVLQHKKSIGRYFSGKFKDCFKNFQVNNKKDHEKNTLEFNEIFTPSDDLTSDPIKPGRQTWRQNEKPAEKTIASPMTTASELSKCSTTAPAAPAA